MRSDVSFASLQKTPFVIHSKTIDCSRQKLGAVDKIVDRAQYFGEARSTILSSVLNIFAFKTVWKDRACHHQGSSKLQIV